MENNSNNYVYTEDQLMARLRFFIGICLALTLFGIVFVVLYSLIFVTQPLNAISPIDQKFFELIVPIATFLTGTLSGIMLAGGDKDAQRKAMEAANKGWDRPAAPTPPLTPTPTPMPGPTPSFSSPLAPPMGGLQSTVSNPFSARQEPVLGLSPVAQDAPTNFTPQVVASFGGKPAPAQPPQPEI